jgi:hypothetical protein
MISKLKLDMKDKDSEILATEKVIDKLKEELKSKEKEIKEKDTIINIMKHGYESYDEENEDSDDLLVKSASKEKVNDNNSSFDFAQLDLDLTAELKEGKDKHTESKENNLKCQMCEYKCKRKNTLKKHINTKHGATRM